MDMKNVPHVWKNISRLLQEVSARIYAVAAAEWSIYFALFIRMRK